jgi:hypothetical protein
MRCLVSVRRLWVPQGEVKSVDYLYENLGPDRFQQFCQSLLLNNFPKLQCLPVRQPDGGRDAVLYYNSGEDSDFIVFQVKFSDKHLSSEDWYSWLSSTLADEAPKIARLAEEGAKEYYLLTNVRGTAHRDSGSIDKTHDLLNERISIPAHCWWRSDLNQRLDNHFDLQWSYPELLSGKDLLSHLVQSRLREDEENQMLAIKAALRVQYDMDEEVRFKQVELQNRLLDLFIDVPMVIRGHAISSRAFRRSYTASLGSMDEQLLELERDDFLARHIRLSSRYWGVVDGEVDAGAASMLLHHRFQNKYPQILLEGAPGQGKSTIVQYLCQVHRMKLLDEHEALAQLPDSHKASNVKIPFKVDLRDYATWIGKQDPFSPEENAEVPEGWKRSLESFLAAQIRHYSGGFDFSVKDLLSVSKLSALLLVLDGLDEVADISVRKDVVKEVTAGVRRLKQNATSLQVIVTSRPAAFANSPGFSERTFAYFELSSISSELINEYAEKWIRARRLHGRREGAEVRKILRSKLDQPHLRDLARNPMQLAILLSLIHTQGSSLPDKRTSLYDNYMNLFFNREAEKSNTVRQHRELLVLIHQYLAWVLHSDAEVTSSRGSISAERLRDLLEEYLVSEQRDLAIVDELFTGMVERVVALVSRVEGTYEFEVQPLREYFAARFLYETAPYSPPGAEAQGTKPDRFDAIARNFYWLNVTRFYAGCYSKGELPSLAAGLAELCREDGYRRINHPRILAATLLADWVFTQYPVFMKDVVKLLLDGLGLRYITSPRAGYRRTINTLTLPKECGGDDLVSRCFELLNNTPAQDYALELTELIKANSDIERRLSHWQSGFPSKAGTDRTRWVQYGLHLELLPHLSNDELEALVSDGYDYEVRLDYISRANRTNFIERSEQHANACTNYILDHTANVRSVRRRPHILTLFGYALNPDTYDLRLYAPMHVSLFEAQRMTGSDRLDEDLSDYSAQYPVFEKCAEVITLAQSQTRLRTHEWSSTLAPWDRIVERSRSLFGERWAHYELATAASGIKSREETYSNYSDLLDYSKSLCRRARYARLRAGNVVWWERQLGRVWRIYPFSLREVSSTP